MKSVNLLLSLLFLLGTAQAADVQLTWTPPTLNEDGSQLTDLAGYKVYYGPTSGNYVSSEDAPDPTLTGYTVTDLTEGNWYFVATAYDTSGNESVYSNEAVLAITVAPAPPSNVIVIIQ